MNRLPRRIITVTAGIILVFVVTLSAFIVSMSRALDAQASEQSLVQVRDTQKKLLNQITLTTFDWAKWTPGVNEIDAGNIGWIQEHLGAAVADGQVMQLAVIWGGLYEQDMSWTTGAAAQGRAGHVEPGMLELVESRLVSIPVGAYEAVKFFLWHKGSLFAVAATRLEDVEGPNAAAAADEGLERLLLGRRLSDVELAEIADSFQLTGFGIVREEPVERPFVPLFGGDGAPTAYLAWDAPHPGGTQLSQKLPLLLVALMLATGLAVLGVALVRRSALHLVLAEQRASEAATQASFAARTDNLTGLPNRIAFNDALAVPARAGERTILFLDVNDFKRVNDSIGHAAADQVIIIVAKRLASLVGPTCLLARIGGDDFVFVLTGTDAEARTSPLADAAEKILAAKLSVLGHQMQLRMAMGYAVQSTDCMTGDDLVRQADLAIYEAKRHKGGPAVKFSSMLEEAAQDASVTERGLRRALQLPGELSMAYQPIVDMDGRMIRAEALARWTSPELGAVAPDRFIAVAERAGLIVELEGKLLQLVCEDMAAHPGLSVSVNVSPLHLMAPNFIPTLLSTMERSGVEPSRVEIELTEAVIVDDFILASERLKELQVEGFSVSLDDFGTGYSSVGYLQKLAFDTIKIDRSFIAKIQGSAKAATVVNSMIAMAHGFDLRVVCEGIETEEEFGMVRTMGCDLAQGYHFNRPMAVGALAKRWLGKVEEQPAAALRIVG